MPGYLVLTQTVNDLDQYLGDYIPQVMPLLEKHGIEVLAAQFGAEPAEGAGNSAIVLKAESTDKLHAFLDDPEYAAPKALRHSITEGQTAIVAPEFAGLPA